MKRTGTIWSVAVLTTMVLTAGCGSTSSKSQPVIETPTKPPQPVIETPASTKPVVIIETSMGAIKAELWADTAPITVANFLAYADAKHFDALIFHRVMQGFMIQGGGFDPAMREKPTRDPIKNEAGGDKKNDRGTLAMARTPVVDSATSQFFINLADNEFLNHRDNTFRGFGYCAFGKVIEGMDVVDKIAAVAVGNAAGHQNVPTRPVLIKSIRRGK